MIRVAVAEDNLLVREGIRLAVALQDTHPDVGVIVVSQDDDPAYALVVDALVASKSRGQASALTALTPREREVLAEIAQGKSNAAIAESLVLTKRAVEKHINAIFLKLGLTFADGVSKRVKATLMFLAEPGRSVVDG